MHFPPQHGIRCTAIRATCPQEALMETASDAHRARQSMHRHTACDASRTAFDAQKGRQSIHRGTASDAHIDAKSY
jgi:hypothetical protein